MAVQPKISYSYSPQCSVADCLIQVDDYLTYFQPSFVLISSLMFLMLRVPPVIKIDPSCVASLRFLCVISKRPRRHLCLTHQHLRPTALLTRNVLERLFCRSALGILVGNSLGGYTLLSIARLYASLHPNPLPPPSTIRRRLLIAHHSSFLIHIFTIFEMSQPSSLSSTFRILFDAALQDYKDKTRDTLTDHPIAKQLETCESVDSIAAILQEQAQSFREFRESDGKLMKVLNSSIDVLCAPSISSALNEAIGLVVRWKVCAIVPCS